MERIIASFNTDTNAIASKQESVGEIVIDGNSIEFYVRDTCSHFVHAFNGGDGHFVYTVFVNGPEYIGNNRTLIYSSCYRVLCVLKSSRCHKDSIEKENVTKCSFTIPELIPWIGMKTVNYEQISMTEAIGIEEELKDITLLKNENKEVKLVFSSKTCENILDNRSATSVLVEKVPEIHITYCHSVSLEQVRSDIQMNMEFWGLIIGHVSTAEDIHVHFCGGNEGEEHDCKMMYINADYSYNLHAIDIFSRPNTNLKMLQESIHSLYERWDNFFHDENYSYIRNSYFMVNSKTQPLLEDVFITYVRILEGYDLRISGDDSLRERIWSRIKPIEKEIKDAIREDEIKKKIESAISPIIDDWKLNSSHAGEIARWIADGFIGKITLETRIRRLDDKHLNIIAKNKTVIEKYDSNSVSAEGYYALISRTRNYYSHFKEDDSRILSVGQMRDTVNVLKGLILMLFYEAMGLSTEDARGILIRNTELSFETQCLLTESERLI